MADADQDNYDVATKIVRRCLGEHVKLLPCPDR